MVIKLIWWDPERDEIIIGYEELDPVGELVKEWQGKLMDEDFTMDDIDEVIRFLSPFLEKLQKSFGFKILIDDARVLGNIFAQGVWTLAYDGKRAIYLLDVANSPVIAMSAKG